MKRHESIRTIEDHDPVRRRKRVALRGDGRGPRRAQITILTALVALAGTASHASPLISEVFYDAVGSDSGHVFVELYGAPGSSLDGLTLEGVNGANGVAGPILALFGVFPADGLFVVADTDSVGGTLVSNADMLINFDFQNGPDSVRLMDGSLQLDAVGYGVFSPSDFFAGEGTPAPDTVAGSSLARVFADFDSDDNEYDFEVLSTPTPGIAAVLSVPEPGSGIMSALGILILGKIYRRPRARLL